MVLVMDMEKRIDDLEFRVTKVESDIEHIDERSKNARDFVAVYSKLVVERFDRVDRVNVWIIGLVCIDIFTQVLRWALTR